MKTISYALLAAALSATASAHKHWPAKSEVPTSPPKVLPSLSSMTFVHNDKASEYHGFKIDVQFYTAPSADKDLEYMHSLKPVVMRLNGAAVDFHPHMVVLRGKDNGCRNADGSHSDSMPPGCHFHCLNDGRYCDYATYNPQTTRAKYPTGLSGHYYVEQSARSSCVWEKYAYGKNSDQLFSYFQYLDAMKGTECDKSFSEPCLEQVSNSVGFDNAVLDECVGALEENLDQQNNALELEINAEFVPKNVPSVFINGMELDNFDSMVNSGSAPQSILQAICDEMPKNSRYPKPPVCDFCLNWCPTVAGSEFNIGTCLWSLQCGAGVPENFDMYSQILEKQAEEESHANDYLYIIATVLAIILAIGLTALTCMAIRVWRTKMIIDRYVKEQQAMNSTGGVNGHRDPTFFPEDNELDLDLEPALQYRDHLNVPPSSSPPSRANFLPQLT